ncbi:hypothetical protein F511_03466 [Dorcoceras hygrometricum]|uniref:Uncharacterized protein n=1 Tax=Dorcoceras hygrometricum TaxID=472368 RepID=A0A2Z7AB59_9LAMI|nr:hypothetical protein F511_03466 [Dorcoceras hygrometricum]
MPPRRRGRGRGQIPVESEGQTEGDQRSFPRRGRDRQAEDEVDELAARVNDMELVMARFQRMNPQVFNGDESSADAYSWLQHVTGLFNRVQYDDDLKLSLATVQLRKLGGRHSNPVVTTPMIALEFPGTTHLSGSHNVALNQVINQSVKQAQDVCMTHLELQIQKLKLAEKLSGSTVRRKQQLRNPLQGRSTASNGNQLFTQRNQQQPSDVAFTKEHQNDAISTNQNNAAALQQLTTDSFLNNQQLVTLNNSNDDVSGTRHHRCQQLITKRYTQNAAFQLNKMTSPHHQQLVTQTTAGRPTKSISHKRNS